MKAELVPDNGDPPIPILKDLTIVGRHESCDIQIDDPSLSKRHCVVVKTDGLLVVRDLATTNGTKVKGQRIRWAALLPDDRLTLGAYKVRIYLGPDELPAPSEGRKRSKKAEPAALAQAIPKPKLNAPTAKPVPLPLPLPLPVTAVVPVPAAATAPMITPAVGFPSPSPLEVPVLGSKEMGLEILDDEDEDSSDSGWRKLIKMRNSGDDEILIELD